MIKYVQIYGERCSGTNYLEALIKLNFNAEITRKFGHKHFFGFNNLENSDDTLFICIVREPVDWLNSLFTKPYHIFMKNIKNVDIFLSSEICSKHNGSEIITDRNIYTNERYKNILELRHIKLKYMIDDLPNKVKNYLFVRYEDLLSDFDIVMNKIKNFNIEILDHAKFPLNTKKYKGNGYIYKKKYYDNITKQTVYENINFCNYYEKKIGYVVDS